MSVCVCMHLPKLFSFVLLQYITIVELLLVAFYNFLIFGELIFFFLLINLVKFPICITSSLNGKLFSNLT